MLDVKLEDLRYFSSTWHDEIYLTKSKSRPKFRPKSHLGHRGMLCTQHEEITDSKKSTTFLLFW